MYTLGNEINYKDKCTLLKCFFKQMTSTNPDFSHLSQTPSRGEFISLPQLCSFFKKNIKLW